jgi:hypothetical protein
MDGIRIAVAEDDIDIQPSNGRILSTDSNIDEASKAHDGIVFMSMHEIDPIDEHFNINAASDMHNNGNSTLTSLEDEIEMDENYEDSAKAHQKSKVEDEVSSNFEVQLDEENSVIRADVSTTEAVIDDISNDERSDNASNGEDLLIECTTENDEKNLIVEPSKVKNQTTPSNNNDSGMSTTSTQQSATNTMNNDTDIRTQMETTTVPEDDRSLLDLFAESAKVYLTQHMVRHLHCTQSDYVSSSLQRCNSDTLLTTSLLMQTYCIFFFIHGCQIPSTDIDCKWDWRSLQCESHCYCSLQWKMGDYHLGRACRRYMNTNSSHRLQSNNNDEDNDDNGDLIVEQCVPTTFIMDQPIPRRLISLIRQTSDILFRQMQRTIRTLTKKVHDRYSILRQKICSDLYSQLYVTLDGAQCWVILPESLTILEKLFCGRNIRQTIPVCQRANNDLH